MPFYNIDSVYIMCIGNTYTGGLCDVITR